MAHIIVFPGGTAPHETALALEARGYRVDPNTGRAHPMSSQPVVQFTPHSLLRIARRFGRWNQAQRGGGHDPHPAA